MGWLSRIADALGFRPPLVIHEPGPLALTEAARRELDALPEGTVLNVAAVPAEGGFVVQVQPGKAIRPLDPELGIAIAPEDRDRMKGLTLDWDGGRWAVKLSLRLDAGDTPNPDGRLYQADRPLARGRPRFFTSGQAHLPDLARRVLAVPGVRSVLFRENALTVEREPTVPWATLDPAVDAALREHFLLCGGEIPAAEKAAADGFAAEVERILHDKVAPAIHHDGGDIELIDVSEDGVVRVHLVGACRSCPAADSTLKMGVEGMLRQALPGRITRVEQV